MGYKNNVDPEKLNYLSERNNIKREDLEKECPERGDRMKHHTFHGPCGKCMWCQLCCQSKDSRAAMRKY